MLFLELWFDYLFSKSSWYANYGSENVQATPKLSEDKVRQCVDPRLGNDYPPKAVAKVIFF